MKTHRIKGPGPLELGVGLIVVKSNFHENLLQIYVEQRPIFLGVVKLPGEGESYLGLVVRDNDSWESVSQRLEIPLLYEESYLLILNLSKSNTYISQSRVAGKEANYVTPAILRIWAGNGYCSKIELLAESPLIEHINWEEYEFILEPEENYKTITLEVFYEVPLLFSYNGQILVDNIQEIEILNN